MSNGIDRQGANDWPKVKHGIQALQEVLDSVTENSNESELLEQLFGLLTWVFTRAIMHMFWSVF